MKRLLMLLTTFCLLLMTTALAETEAEWNAKCEWKTGTGTTLYAVTQGTATSSDLSDFVPVGTLPANTLVELLLKLAQCHFHRHIRSRVNGHIVAEHICISNLINRHTHHFSADLEMQNPFVFCYLFHGAVQHRPELFFLHGLHQIVERCHLVAL